MLKLLNFCLGCAYVVVPLLLFFQSLPFQLYRRYPHLFFQLQLDNTCDKKDEDEDSRNCENVDVL